MTRGSNEQKVFLDLTHLGRHVTGIERIAIEQFEKTEFDGAEIISIRAGSVPAMILKQQVLLPLLALLHPKARFAFPGFPPSPLFTLFRNRAVFYVHDTFLITRGQDLSLKARLYMAPGFKIAVGRLKHFLVNSEKTQSDLSSYIPGDASIKLYRPAVSNVFKLESQDRFTRADQAIPLKLVALGTVEPRKNYRAALTILDALRAAHDAGAELHIIGREGWGDEGQRIKAHPGVTVHGYLPGAEVSRIMNSADVYICTSHDEGLGLPLLEAQYAGLAVVAPDQSVFREVLGSSATFIDPADATISAAAISKLVTTPGWRAACANAATGNLARWNALAESDLTDVRCIFAGPQVSAVASSVAYLRQL